MNSLYFLAAALLLVFLLLLSLCLFMKKEKKKEEELLVIVEQRSRKHSLAEPQDRKTETIHENINKSEGYVNAYKGFRHITCTDIRGNLMAVGTRDNQFKVFSLKQLASPVKEYLYILTQIAQ